MHSALASTSAPLSILFLNQLWFVDELRARGHRVVTAGLNAKAFDVQLTRGGMNIHDLIDVLPKGFDLDCIVYHDDSGPPTVTGLEDLDKLLVFYSVDAHHHHAWHSIFGALYDLVLVAHKDYVPCFKPNCSDVRWFPLWAPLDLSPEPEKTIDVAFRGNLDPKLHPERAKFMSALAEQFSIDAKMGAYDKVYTKAKIVINQAVKKDLNFRVFEGMMSGALLVTPMIENGLCDLFTPGEDLVTYEDGDAKDATRVIGYYLENENERQRIAANGYQKMCQFHTKARRAEELEALIAGRKSGIRRQKYLASALIYLKSSFSFQKVLPNIAKDYAMCAARNILASIERGEPQPGDFLQIVLRILQRLDELMLFEENSAFVAILIDTFPDEVLYKAASVASLVERGDEKEARVLAERYSDHADQYLREIPLQMRQVKAELAGKPLTL